MRYAIIGAGIAGLTAAWEIHRRDPEAEVEVFEATDRIGGKLCSVPFEAGPVDLGAEAFLVRRPAARELIDELGLGDDVVGTSGLHSTVFTGGVMKPLPAGTVMGIPATSEPVAHLVSAETAARIDAEGDAEPVDWPVGGDLNVGELVRARYGGEVVERAVSALLGGVYSCTADDLGVRATVPQLAEAFDAMVEANEKPTLSGAVKRVLDSRAAQAAAKRGEKGARGSVAATAEPTTSAAHPAGTQATGAVAGDGAQPADGAGGAEGDQDGVGKRKKRPVIFGTLRGGFRELYEALAEASGARIYLDAFVSGLARDGEGYRLTGAGEGTYDAVLVATPAPTTARLLAAVSPATAETLRPVKLAGSVVVGLRLESGEGFPQNSGVLVAGDEPGVHAKAFTFSSKKWPHLAERGGLILRASFGRFGDDALIREDEDTLVDYALDDLKTITGFDAREAGVAEIYVQRWLGGIPRYDEHHLEHVAATRAAVAEVPGVEVTGSWAGGVGVPAVIADARAAAARLLGQED